MTSRALCTLLSLLSITLGATGAMAQSQDAVLVLSHGGIEQLEVQDLQPSPQGDLQVVDLGRLRIFSAQDGPQTLEDLRVLPDGRLLVAGFSKRQVALLDPLDPEQNLRLYNSPDNFSQLTSVAVITYGAFGSPTRFAFADSQLSLVSIYDTQDKAIVRRDGAFITGGRASFAQSILLPQGRMATATNWNALGVYAIDLIELTPQNGGPTLTRFTNTTHIDQPSQTFVRQEIDQLRDLMGLDAQTLLVTTRFSVFAMTTSGEILWRLNTADDPDLGGELASARVTPGGKLIVASFEPGAWTQPHPNHKVRWYSLPEAPASTPTLIASTGPLSRAPRRIEPYFSTGGTGTLNYSAGLQDLATGDLSKLIVKAPLALSGQRLRPDEQISASVTFVNEGINALGLSKLAVIAFEGGDCQDPQASLRVLLEATDVLIEPMSERALEGAIRYDDSSPLKPGNWCTQAAAQDKDGQWITFGPELTIDVFEGDPTGPKPLPFEDLGLQTPSDMDQTDMGAGDMGPSTPSKPPTDEGCGCAQSKPQRHSATAILWGLILGGVALRRRRKRAAHTA